MSRKQCVILAALALAVVIVFACLLEVAPTDVPSRAPTEACPRLSLADEPRLEGGPR